jgi:hypothetical protein
MKSKLKPPGTKRLKRNCGPLVSNSAFKFNLRRYNLAATNTFSVTGGGSGAGFGDVEASYEQIARGDGGGGGGGLTAGASSRNEVEYVLEYSPLYGTGRSLGMTGRGLHSSTCQLNLSRS